MHKERGEKDRHRRWIGIQCRPLRLHWLPTQMSGSMERLTRPTGCSGNKARHAERGLLI